MTKAEQRELYLLLRHDPETGANRGREFYDGHCQECDSYSYEAHQPHCRLMALLIALGGDEERERQRIRAEAVAEAERGREAKLERHRRGVVVSDLDAMNLAFKKAYGDFDQ